ncbi:helix-turn-helix domain-containing protein [Streptosporangium roseum]|uniref:helix-turn-helix domain-containing protein n=1 Tax=Streptosporangium roseum TaxID=2001 RepID=UPI0004CD9548|nr:helix-turn-helix domain-containing protein [Streptosporangium roseum]
MHTPNDGGPRGYKVSRVADLLDAHPNTIYAWIHSGRLRAVRIGRTYRGPAESLAEFTADRRGREAP